MFGAIIIHIGNYGSPIVTKSILIIPTVESVESHVHGSGVFGNNGVVCDTISSQVVRLEGQLWLGITYLYEILAERDHLLGGDE